MKKAVYLILLFLLFTGIRIEAQHVLLLKKPGTIKYFTYRIGTDIDLMLKKSGKRIQAVITDISDTSITVNEGLEIQLENIGRIYRERHYLTVISKVTRIAGIGYITLDIFNRTINKEAPVVHRNTVIISAALVGFSYALRPLHYRKCVIGKPWVLQVLDFSFTDMPGSS